VDDVFGRSWCRLAEEFFAVAGAEEEGEPVQAGAEVAVTLKRSMANFAAGDLDGLVRIIKRKLKGPVPAPPDRRLPDRH
jgi:hypothetical protein